MPYAFHLRLGGARWAVFVSCVLDAIRKSFAYTVRYGTYLIVFLLLLVIVVCDLYFDSHILIVLIIILILIIHIISITCVYVREYYEYSLTAIKSLL